MFNMRKGACKMPNIDILICTTTKRNKYVTMLTGARSKIAQILIAKYCEIQIHFQEEA